MDLGGGSDRATNVAFQTIQRLHQMSNHSEANAESGVKKFTFFNAAVAEMEAERPERTESTLVFRGKVENDGANVGSGRSLFIFSENNLLRKAAKALIDWGYPFITFGLSFLMLTVIII
ncbi:unnamed protein product [Hymenolepis diminuta]|uniref:Uncharacterized protein n=1 Tax=Hymenolepis diminuta TaxID=6216 RepID=A0A564YLI3_HYMDI|nr:unnamed protein product [Hymenolepis diminuta]